MPSDRRDRISDLYHRALARAPEDRAAFLVEACNGDEALKEEVASLLAFEPASARLLEGSPIAVAAVAAGATSMIDRRIGPYTIVAQLGAGGMGEVYRARDSKLGRDVAIKILPSHFTADPERRARFAREARTLATLNHPHIGAIYGLEEVDGIAALVLELVEGPTLADRLERGAVPLPQVLAIARQIAGALEAAHEKGIVHRDLKPANIVLQGGFDHLSNEVRARVLDFGLAKPMTLEAAAGPTGPTGSFDGTAAGRILGTPAYMSPEQARGLAVDRRTDIWAFGCVLFEMLSGRRAFDGNTMSDTFVSVLEREPDWDALPRQTPSAVRTLLLRCLRKDPQKRLHDVADAILDIDDAIANPTGAVVEATAGRVRSRRAVLPWLVAVALAIALAWLGRLYQRGSSALPGELTQLSIHSPEGGANSVFALSPNGRYLAFTPILAGRPRLWVYSFETGETTALPGTEGARASFWKFDSQEIAFFAGDQLNTVSLRGGLPVKVATVDPNVAGGSWGRNNVIIMTKLGDALQRVSAGGKLEAVTVLRIGEALHAAPEFLPDGVHFLYLAVSADFESRELRIGSLESKEMVDSLGPVESTVAYADGHLLTVRGGHIGGGSLTTRSFDPVRRRLTGDPVALGLPAAVYAPAPAGAFSVSETGRLVFLARTGGLYDLTWFNRSGEKSGTVGEPGVYHHLDISPDDQRVAVTRRTQEPGKPAELDIWRMDLKSGGDAGAHRVTTDPAGQVDPAWSGDGLQLAFNSDQQPDRVGRRWRLWIRPSDGSGKDVSLAEPVTTIASPDWSLDNRHIIYEDAGDLWIVPTSGAAKPSAFVKTPDDSETDPVFSRDGRWVAYTSDRSSRDEVYIRAFPRGETVHQVSREGGWAPRWRGDGKELFFLSLDSTVMAATIDPATGVATGVPRALFPTGLRRGFQKRPYDVTTDGQRFLVPTMRPPEPFRVVLNWRALLPK